MSVDLQDGRVVAVRPAQSHPGLWMTVLPIHSGDTFGRAGSFVVLVGGLALMALAATGPIMWLRARNSRRPRPGETPG